MGIKGRIVFLTTSREHALDAFGVEASQYLYLSNGAQYGLRRTMAEIYEMLACYREFSRVGVAYIVNLEHVDSMNAQEVQMDNGRKIYLPRGSYQSLWERYFGYYCDENEVL